MWITKVKINNYKSYLDTPEVELSKGINIIVGQNNAGKTALLEILSGNGRYNTHLNGQTKPRKTSYIKEDYKWKDAAEIEVFVDSKILLSIVEDKSPKGLIYFRNSLLGISKIEFDDTSWSWTKTEDYPEADESIDNIKFDGFELTKTLVNIMRNDISLQMTVFDQRTRIKDVYDAYNKYSGKMNALSLDIFELERLDDPDYLRMNTTIIPSEYEISEILKKEFVENRIYKFDIHRTVRSKGNNENKQQLSPDCSNLADMLRNLHEDRKSLIPT
ncbi:MAG: AAA family ATPase [Saprospiraceae bacterium]|nr:AAA family ATPase [Saprospiraceae bacterium]